MLSLLDVTVLMLLGENGLYFNIEQCVLRFRLTDALMFPNVTRNRGEHQRLRLFFFFY